MNSEKLKKYLEDFRIMLAVGAVIGLILGLVIGWGIWPVQWTDLAPYHLRPDLREDYLRMAVFTSTSVGDIALAEKAWYELGDTALETMDTVRNQPGFLSDAQIASFMTAINADAGEVLPEVEEVIPAEGVETERSGPNWSLLVRLCFGLVAVIIGVALFFFWKSKTSRDSKPGAPDPHSRFDDAGYDQDIMSFTQEPEPGYIPSFQTEHAEPVAQFMTTYMVGDDLYDDSFSIDAVTGEFLGECGVGISETVGVGEPKRVTAFEVWLFDKNDIQTVTKVVMSEHAHDDDKIRMRLESKGELVLAEPGKVVLLETATLQLEARIIDMKYGEGAAPDLSFFERLTMELIVWPKEPSLS
ncbi:MAG: hypothetical protein GX142_00535 [Chloroflexi bacterium]|jgi:hypothetical protein|nr:hypothetical protein [Chloroflexota bacterium]